MIEIFLTLAATAVPQSLLDAADAANLAHTQCVFATMRAANQAHLPAGELDAKLRSNCSSEAKTLRRISTRISTLRGEPNLEATAQQLIDDSYATVVEEYRRLPEIEKQLRDYCKADPKACN